MTVKLRSPMPRHGTPIVHWRSFFLLGGSIFASLSLAATAQDASDAVARVIASGDDLFTHKHFIKALEAYQKADKSAHHTSALAYLRMIRVYRRMGDFSSALDDAKKAEKVAGNDKSLAVTAHLARGSLLSAMAGKPSDKN